MIEALKGYDWEEAFGVADANWCLGAAQKGKHPWVSVEDVEVVLALRAGQNDGDSWLCLGQLKTGEFFFLTAWCDYTGWGCQDGGSISISDSLENLKQFGMTPDEKSDLGVA